MKVCVIMQGVPGSGKSFIAEIVAKSINANIHSTDNFFIDENGNYSFDETKLDEYHKQNYSNAKADMENGLNVVIDNTNIKQWQVDPYIKVARDNEYMVQFIRVSGNNFGNQHDVPVEKIATMYHTMENLVPSLSPRYIRCNNPRCGVSTFISDELSFGCGQLDQNGFWEEPCSICARAHEQAYPEDGRCLPYEGWVGNLKDLPQKKYLGNMQKCLNEEEDDWFVNFIAKDYDSLMKLINSEHSVSITRQHAIERVKGHHSWDDSYSFGYNKQTALMWACRQNEYHFYF